MNSEVVLGPPHRTTIRGPHPRRPAPLGCADASTRLSASGRRTRGYMRLALLGAALAGGCEDSEGALLVPVTDDGTDVAAIQVSPQVASISEVGGQLQFSAVPVDSTGTRLEGLAITWSSDNAAVATVAPDGIATAHGSGLAIITAAAGGAEGTASLRVTLAEP